MKPERWETLSGWLNAWIAADPAERDRLRARLAGEDPDLAAEAEALAAASGRLEGFLETPALVLEARRLAQEDALLPAGSMVGPYRVVSLLARGGMGDVYRATDTRLQRDVALKVLAQSKTGDPRRVERFMHEARVTASLDDPNVVRVYDVGFFDEQAFLVAELLDGETLRTRIARGPMHPDDVVRVGLEVASGLAAAHSAGLVHRDLKPDNIFLTRSGTTKILDFGIAKLAQDETVRDGYSTLTGVVLGTAGYLSPEQIKGEAVDARADLFALGAVMFEMLTSSRAFAREHLVDTLHAILHDSPTTALAERDDVPPALADIVMRLLEKQPDARFQSSADLIAALQRVDATGADRDSRVAPREPVKAAGRSIPPAAARARLTRWAPLAVAGVLAAAATAWYAWRPREVTLAVMTFQSIPASAEGELLEFGLAGEFINRLGQLPDVRVLPLTATDRLRKEKDAREAALRLGATHMLAGILQRDGNSMRANVQLVRTSDGRALVSIPPFPVDSSRIFDIQDIIVTNVVAELVPQLAREARSRLVRAGTQDNQAFVAYLRGLAHVGNPTPTDLRRAAEFFGEAVRRDPTYADAWAGLGSAYKRMPVAGPRDPDPLRRAREAAQRALQLDRDHPEAHSVLGTVAFWYDWNYAEAERLLRRALQLQPSSADARLFLAHLLSNIGRHDAAIEEIRLAHALDPGWPLPPSLHGQFLFMARRYPESIQQLDAATSAFPDSWNAHIMRAYPLLAVGRYDEAIEECDRAVEIRRRIDSTEEAYPFAIALRGHALAQMGRQSDALEVLARLESRGAPPMNGAMVLLGLEQDDAAIAKISEAVKRRDQYVTFLGVDPKFDRLRARPEFRELLSEVNLLQFADRFRPPE